MKVIWLDRFLCRYFGHSKKIRECNLGGHHCARCNAYLNVCTHQPISGWPKAIHQWAENADAERESK